jgi:hypothetical protein
MFLSVMSSKISQNKTNMRRSVIGHGKVKNKNQQYAEIQ